jgi:tetratricopeptide (TPR) repeat protein
MFLNLRCLVLLFEVLFTVTVLSAQSNQSRIETYSREGQQALMEGRYADAEKSFEKLRELQPQIAEVHANLGLIYFEQRKFSEAVPELQRALKLKPSLAKTESLLGMSLAELGRYHEALRGLEKGFRSQDPEIRRMSGLQLERAYLRLRLETKAVEIALELNRRYPDDPEVLYHNGRIFGGFAFLTMERLAKVAPDSIWRYQAVAEAAESEESFDIAIAGYRRVLTLNPKQPGIHYRLGRTLLARARKVNSSEDFLNAEKEFRAELEQDPRNGNALYEIAELKRNSGNFAEAQSIFEQALSFHPDFEEAHVGLAYVLAQESKLSDALAHLQKAIALRPDDEVAWFRLSQVQRSRGQAEEAEQAQMRFQQLRLEKSKQHEPDLQAYSKEEVSRQTLDSNDGQ